MSNIGQSIRAHRKRLVINQKTLASRVRVSFTTVRRWEKNERAPRADELQRLCEVLGVSEAELLRGPAEEDWVLEIKARGKEVINMDKAIGCISSVNCGSDGAVLTLGGRGP